MAKLQFSMIPSLVILAAVSSGAAAQSDGCTNVVVSMSPCLNYGNSSAAPSAACCAQLNTVARSRPECLCQVINSTTLGLSVDQTQAQALPKACSVQTPNCKAASPPGSTPNSGGGSSSPGNGSSDAASIRFSTLFAIFLLFTAHIMFLNFSSC
ncbi:non-specific lipid transfer protein GPI-anchored 5-like isoform X1 [Salvia miltiorrhiza]|uniref:non-specific lipid transfer protein GPI-anchored 5-like isoform X1 n=1 Tax=Salvia miltiorrhiza TaxID=226208 RepID=UPI0025ACE87A|nr:non-specific lipid transfer protein GPI-anchored 5-like isoform X1 [Salvia miltiorrhiza]XP_057783416.1 non-specific lipid transfer protein GPI-anchored 5-like isoform X1 [Salvia miltiorrhiza]